MFRVTFIGHQGWLVASDATAILLDPLLCDHFGHQPGGAFDVFPPRRFDFECFPRISAVVLSHEHEDHFNLATLRRIDRRIPIYLSDRTSSAGRRILAELGFTVRLLHPSTPERIGDLEVRPFAQSMAGNHPGEWDTMALLVRDIANHGSFFTTVDHRVARSVIEALSRERLRPHIWTWPNNEMDFSWLTPARPHTPDDTAGLERDLRDLTQRTLPRDLEPSLVTVCGNGFSFRSDTSWMNRAIFNRDTALACERASRGAGRTRFVAPLPGETVAMREGAIVSTGEPCGFIATRPRVEWPPHEASYAPIEEPGRFLPATGRRALLPGEPARLAAALDGLARSLYARPLFMTLYELGASGPSALGSSVALSLLAGDDRGAELWTYEPWACRFAHAPGAQRADYLAGLEVWATDLLAVLEARLAPGQVMNGRATTWNMAPEALFHLLTVYAHPLNLPDGFLALYRSVLGADPASPVIVHPGPLLADG